MICGAPAPSDCATAVPVKTAKERIDKTKLHLEIFTHFSLNGYSGFIQITSVYNKTQRIGKNRGRQFSLLLGVTVLTVASYWTIRLALADQLFQANSFEALARATRLNPINSQYFLLLAEYQQRAGIDSEPSLVVASKVNPLDSSIWIRRGLSAEFAGDFGRAEKFLLEAARVDKLFDPRATLANYYFRRNDPEQFWRWTREALAISYGDLTSLFRLCWRMSGDPEIIRSRALPTNRRVLRSYLYFLLGESRLDAAEPIALQLATAATGEDADVLLDFIDRSLTPENRISSLVTVWNSLCTRNVVPFSPVSLDRALTNGDFRFAFTSRGFDWRVPQGPDITAVRVNPGELRIDLSGKQPEQCELLVQFVPLLSARACRFRFSYQTNSVPAGSGLRWRILTAASSSLSSDDWKQMELPFSTQDAKLARLVLEYSRVSGTSRLEGSIALRDLELECTP